MDKEGMRLKKCSTPTDVEHTHDLSNSRTGEEKKRKKSTVHEDTNHSWKVKKVGASKKTAAHDATIGRLAATIKEAHDEIIKLRESIKEMTKTMKKQQEILLTMAGTMKNLRVKETPKEKPAIKRECAFERGYDRNNKQTIFVKGYDPSMRRDDVEKALVEHFRSCGEITRVFVPFKCYTLTSIGFAFMDLKEDGHRKKALLLDGSYMGGKKLEVTMAFDREEFNPYETMRGCSDCRRNVQKHIYKKGYVCGRRSIPLSVR
ncbi:unnamed protein product [Eruca vesicaria subsp. sativa]|uniref:RRM domain-containing protein n=1 Tax=Eruca vesicaria subsp. sativa TaxID=29727 RepID=A0ABC8J6J6_ERUVS|nr:unnamed protein product [Eruca vesicaria subsp. sativa]